MKKQETEIWKKNFAAKKQKKKSGKKNERSGRIEEQ